MKQLRSVVETEYSVDEVFDCLCYNFERGEVSKLANKTNSEAVKMAAGSIFTLGLVRELNAVTGVVYREVPFPWYV